MNDERKKALQKIKTARGQLDGIIRMMKDAIVSIYQIRFQHRRLC